MSHMIYGLFGMILSVWTMFGTSVAFQYEFCVIIATFVFISSITTLCFSYHMFCNAMTTLYVRIPSENRPFSGIKLYVILFGLLHLSVSVAIVQLMKNWPICLLLIASSFIFCCDAWACVFTESYMLCEHRKNKFEMKTVEPIDGIIHNVVVRRVYEMNKKSQIELPDGFEFDDELRVDEKWNIEDEEDPLEEKCFWC
ncbi:unnamed protein product [Caenorhabditis brenneri]